MISTVLVGTDGSPQAQAAIEYAAGLSAQLGALALLVHASGLLEQLPGHEATPSSTLRSEIERLIETDWPEPFRRRNLPHSSVVEDGPPLLVLPRVAEQRGADLIVVGSHGLGNPAALPLGSTAHGLLQLSPVPVLVVPVRNQRLEA